MDSGLCPACGTPHFPSAYYCLNCGAAIPQDESAAGAQDESGALALGSTSELEDDALVAEPVVVSEAAVVADPVVVSADDDVVEPDLLQAALRGYQPTVVHDDSDGLLAEPAVVAEERIATEVVSEPETLVEDVPVAPTFPVTATFPEPLPSPMPLAKSAGAKPFAEPEPYTPPFTPPPVAQPIVLTEYPKLDFVRPGQAVTPTTLGPTPLASVPLAAPYPAVAPGALAMPGAKSKLVAGLLGIFLGGFGVHNFYLGKTNRGLLQLLVSIVGSIFTLGIAGGVMALWGLIEGIMILASRPGTPYDLDGNGQPLRP